MSIAETIGPSVRGALRIQVLVLLALAGAATGALVGLLAGAAWRGAGLPEAAPVAALVVAAAAAVLEASPLRPPSVRTQVPQLWGRLLGPRTVAVVYGARLGIGPATILPTWLWWAAFMLGATTGPWWSAATGAAFALTRAAWSTAATAGIDDGSAMVRRTTALWQAERHMRWLAVAAALVVGAFALAGCSDGGDDDPERSATTLALEPSTTTTTTVEDLALAELLPDDALPGFIRSEDGPLDLEAAAEAEADIAAERARLETRHFQRGAYRQWLAPNDDVVYVSVYELAKPSDATAYLADGVETLAARAATPFDVPEIAGAHGFTTVDEADERAFTAHAVAFSLENRWFLVVVGSDAGARTVEEARSVAATLAGAAMP